ncbi:MAG: SGNH/GDSL hydrolase family protein [Bacteroidia bacterium]|nr:SGNH/GDSL hydrolase family protein [Bacteroidia bacterium]
MKRAPIYWGEFHPAFKKTSYIRMKHKSFVRLAILALCIFCIAATIDKVSNVLIIGDSISIGYTPFVQKALAPDINLEHNDGNGGSTVRGVDSIENWVGNKQWDVILFNFGLHDLVHKDSLNKYDVNSKVAVTLDEYRKNLEVIVSKLKETTATIIFITTTEVPENSAGRKVEDPVKYNKVALEVMKKNNIKVVDLYTLSLSVHPRNSKPGNVHYTDKGYELLSEPLIKAIRIALKK